jgi:ABC-type polysaccharide/polyol phosphate export permease
MNFIESSILFLFALFAFDMVIQGDISALILMFLAGNIAFAGIAVFVSSHTSNTEVGNGLINFIVTPMMVLSGIFFSYSNFPDWSICIYRKARKPDWAAVWQNLLPVRNCSLCLYGLHSNPKNAGYFQKT